MTLKEKIENNVAVWLLATLLTGFLSGIAAYKGVIEIAALDHVPEGQYLLKPEVDKSYVDRNRYDTLVATYQVLKSATAKGSAPLPPRFYETLTRLGEDGEALKKHSGEELTNGFNRWRQECMQVLESFDGMRKIDFDYEVRYQTQTPEGYWLYADPPDDAYCRSLIDRGIGILRGVRSSINTDR